MSAGGSSFFCCSFICLGVSSLFHFLPLSFPLLSFPVFDWACSDETSEIFLKAAAQLQSQGITFNDATIQAKKQAEREKEAARAQALASSSSGGGGGAAKAGGSMSILGGLGGGSGTSKSVGGGSGGAMASATKVDDDFDAPEL